MPTNLPQRKRKPVKDEADEKDDLSVLLGVFIFLLVMVILVAEYRDVSHPATASDQLVALVQLP